MSVFRSSIAYLVALAVLLLGTAPTGQAQLKTADDALSQDSIRVVPKPAEDQVDIFVGDALFTSYLFSEKHDVLKKPVLYPIKTALGTDITRAFPLAARAGERVDHPHHVGLWFNYGSVNGLDFWNNSDAVSAEEAEAMGAIEHLEIRRVESGEDKGALEVVMHWLKPSGEPLLREDTRFVFHADPPDARVIDRITTLTALDETVRFEDNKEGLLGLRVRRELEMPAEEPLVLTDARGEPLDDPVVDNEGVEGQYYSSEGIEGYPDVWGTRAKWMALEGEIKRKPVTIAILDHPQNPGFPTYWHVRNYGLFSANPLGQKVFSEGKKELGFALEPDESATFRHRILLLSGDDTDEEIRSYYKKWTEEP